MRLSEPAPADAAARAAHEATVEGWLAGQQAENPMLVAVDRDLALRRWYVRFRGEQRDYVAIWLTLGDYTLAHEAYFMPAPEEKAEAVYAMLLACNRRLFGMGFAIGAEDALYLMGRISLSCLDEATLDRVVGGTYEAVERWFRPAMRLGFGTNFR